MLAVKQVGIGNRILAAFPQEEFSRFFQHLETVRLEKGEVVYIAGDKISHAYFPLNGLLSLLSTTETGSTLEVAMVANEGMVGLPTILGKDLIPYEVTVRIATEAFKIRSEALQEEFDKGQALQDGLLRYLNVLITQISQSTICNRFHTLEEALSRWLLTVQDRLNSNTLDFTQETISYALGVPRTGVTMAAGTLQKAGLISYSRGKIVILDRPNLEARSCECYRIVHDELNIFLNK
jgi:CRP-like cAMP-binding protein